MFLNSKSRSDRDGKNPCIHNGASRQSCMVVIVPGHCFPACNRARSGWSLAPPFRRGSPHGDHGGAHRQIAHRQIRLGSSPCSAPGAENSTALKSPTEIGAPADTAAVAGKIQQQCHVWGLGPRRGPSDGTFGQFAERAFLSPQSPLAPLQLRMLPFLSSSRRRSCRIANPSPLETS